MTTDIFNNSTIDNIKNNFLAFYNTDVGLICVVLGGSIISCCLLLTTCSIASCCRRLC